MNRVFKFGIFVCGLLVAASAFGQNGPTDADISRMLVGKWESIGAPPIFGAMQSTVSKDGTYKLKGIIKSEKGDIAIDEVGKWHVSDNHFILAPNNPAPGAPKSMAMVVVEINDRSFKVRGENQPVVVWNRAK